MIAHLWAIKISYVRVYDDQWKIYDTYTKYTKIYNIVSIVSVSSVT